MSVCDDDKQIPHAVSLGWRIFPDRGVLTIPVGYSVHDAVHSVLDALAEGYKFMVLDLGRRSPAPGDGKR